MCVIYLEDFGVAGVAGGLRGDVHDAAGLAQRVDPHHKVLQTPRQDGRVDQLSGLEQGKDATPQDNDSPVQTFLHSIHRPPLLALYHGLSTISLISTIIKFTCGKGCLSVFFFFNFLISAPHTHTNVNIFLTTWSSLDINNITHKQNPALHMTIIRNYT